MKLWKAWQLELMNDAEREQAMLQEAELVRHLPDGRYISVYPLWFGNWQLTISEAGNFEEHYDTWTYDLLHRVLYQAMKWSGDRGTEPEGWIRNPPTGRRRPDGDAKREYVSA
jgi:hypothetical protein